MEKEKLISKLNIKDYNNQLEKILSKKTFTEDTKNLLLSMLYKIENAYEDYKKVSVDAKTKREILEEILDIISNDCETIEIVKSKESFCDIEKKKITTYLNVRKMLYEIYQINHNKFRISNEYEIIKPAFEKTLNQGYSISSDEIIRDFDGWSWNIEPREIENILANLIYQVLKILVGQNVLETWKKNNTIDFISEVNNELTKKFKQELGEQLFKTIAQICILNITQTDEEERKRLIEKQKELQKEFNQLDNKKEYLETLGRTKKQIIEKIKKIDDILNNDIKLKKEFIKRNEVLDMNHRIFSLSDLSEILENERKELIDNLNKCSKKMEPLNFIKTKTEIENKLVLLKELKLEKQNKEILFAKVNELLNLVCKSMKIQIDNAEEKEDIIKLIYVTRYFGLIYVSETEQVKDRIDINLIQRLIITKACKHRIITIFSKNIKENYTIIKNILQTDIIELEKMYLRFNTKTNKTILEIYDEENMYNNLEIPNIEEPNVKQNKKIKVFI